MLRKGKRIISRKVEYARSGWEKFRGLMLRDSLDHALIFVLENESRIFSSIHTLFMRFQIDVIFLDKRKRVVDMHRNARPWLLNITPRKPARYIIEMPRGMGKNIKLGDKLLF